MAQYGIYEKALISENLEESLIYASKEGYNFWEIAVDNDRKERLYWDEQKIHELVTLCQKTNMPIFNMVLSLHRDYPLGSSDPQKRYEAVEYLYKAIDLAVKLGIRTIQLAGYYTSSALDNDGTILEYTESLKKGAAYASSNGVILAIENMDYGLTDSTSIISIIEEVNNPYLGAFLDVGNFAANKFNPIKELEKALPYIFGLHLKETKIDVYRRVKFGEGIVDFKSILQFLKSSGYDGYLGIEMWNDDNPESLEEIKNAINWLKNQI